MVCLIEWLVNELCLAAIALAALLQCQQQSSAEDCEQTRAGFWHIADEVVAQAGDARFIAGVAGVRGVTRSVESFRPNFLEKHRWERGDRRRKLGHIRRVKGRHVRCLSLRKEVQEAVSVESQDIRRLLRYRAGLQQHNVPRSTGERQLIGERHDARKRIGLLETWERLSVEVAVAQFVNRDERLGEGR